MKHITIVKIAAKMTEQISQEANSNFQKDGINWLSTHAWQYGIYAWKSVNPHNTFGYSMVDQLSCQISIDRKLTLLTSRKMFTI